jgi:hypothetical protein
MKKLHLIILSVLIASLSFYSCEFHDEDEDEIETETIQVNETSIIPNTTSGRPNTYLGCVEISSRITTIEVWDHGAIDGDVVSIIANGNTIIEQQTLDGPQNPIRVDYDFGYNGYNYVTLYAHNLGDIPPNTCTVAINGIEFVLEANLDANGSVDIVVEGYGVSCGSGGGTGGDTGGGSGDNNTGDIIFWTNNDLGCGPITVNVSGVGSTTITGFYSSTPVCSDTGAGGNLNNLPLGDYTYTASCSGGYTWSGSFTIVVGCTRFQLTL